MGTFPTGGCGEQLTAAEGKDTEKPSQWPLRR